MHSLNKSGAGTDCVSKQPAYNYFSFFHQEEKNSLCSDGEPSDSCISNRSNNNKVFFVTKHLQKVIPYSKGHICCLLPTLRNSGSDECV